MSKKSKLALTFAAEPTPIAETQVILTALEPLNKDARVQVLTAAIAFYGIGNAELNARA